MVQEYPRRRKRRRSFDRRTGVPAPGSHTRLNLSSWGPFDDVNRTVTNRNSRYRISRGTRKNTCLWTCLPRGLGTWRHSFVVVSVSTGVSSPACQDRPSGALCSRWTSGSRKSPGPVDTSSSPGRVPRTSWSRRYVSESGTGPEDSPGDTSTVSSQNPLRPSHQTGNGRPRRDSDPNNRVRSEPTRETRPWKGTSRTKERSLYVCYSCRDWDDPRFLKSPVRYLPTPCLVDDPCTRPYRVWKEWFATTTTPFSGWRGEGGSLPSGLRS